MTMYAKMVATYVAALLVLLQSYQEKASKTRQLISQGKYAWNVSVFSFISRHTVVCQRPRKQKKTRDTQVCYLLVP